MEFACAREETKRNDDDDDDDDWSRWKSSTRYAIRTRLECTLGSGSAFGTESSRERASLEFRGIQSYPYPLPIEPTPVSRQPACSSTRSFPLSRHPHPSHKDVPHYRKHCQPLVGCALAPLRAQSNPVEFRHARHHQLRIYTEAHAAKKIHLVTDDDAVSRVRLVSSFLSHQRQRLPSLMHRGNPSNGERQTRSRYAPRTCVTLRRRVVFFSFLAKHLSYQP